MALPDVQKAAVELTSGLGSLSDRAARIELWGKYKPEFMDGADITVGWLGWLQYVGYTDLKEETLATLQRSVVAWEGSRRLKEYQDKIIGDEKNPFHDFVDTSTNKYIAAARARKAEKRVSELFPENDLALGLVAQAMMGMVERGSSTEEFRALMGEEALTKLAVSEKESKEKVEDKQVINIPKLSLRERLAVFKSDMEDNYYRLKHKVRKNRKKIIPVVVLGSPVVIGFIAAVPGYMLTSGMRYADSLRNIGSVLLHAIH